MADRNPRRSSSSSPMRKKNKKMPMLSTISMSVPGTISPGHGTENNSRDGIGNNGVNTKASEDAFEQLGDDDHRADGKKRSLKIQVEAPSPKATNQMCVARMSKHRRIA